MTYSEHRSRTLKEEGGEKKESNSRSEEVVRDVQDLPSEGDARDFGRGVSEDRVEVGEGENFVGHAAAEVEGVGSWEDGRDGDGLVRKESRSNWTEGEPIRASNFGGR